MCDDRHSQPYYAKFEYLWYWITLKYGTIIILWRHTNNNNKYYIIIGKFYKKIGRLNLNLAL